MAARGNDSKLKITQTILSTFPGSFIYDKNIIIPMVEGSETLQIKVALTCAKTNVEAGGDTVLPGTIKVEPSNTPVAPAPRVEPVREVVQPTAEEKHNVSELLKLLDF